MSTILHPVQHHTWWYALAAAALVTGLLVVLMTSVFGTDGSVTAPAPAPAEFVGHGGHAYAVPCFAGRPGTSIELARSGCMA